MTPKNFNLAWATLLNAYPQAAERITTETRDIYWKMLHEIPDDLWTAGIEKCLANFRSEFNRFPSINELGTFCCGGHNASRVWREDPWRARNGYWEYIPEITWQESLRQILIERGLLPSPEEPRALERREKPD